MFSRLWIKPSENEWMGFIRYDLNGNSMKRTWAKKKTVLKAAQDGDLDASLYFSDEIQQKYIYLLYVMDCPKSIYSGGGPSYTQFDVVLNQAEAKVRIELELMGFLERMFYTRNTGALQESLF